MSLLETEDYTPTIVNTTHPTFKCERCANVFTNLKHIIKHKCKQGDTIEVEIKRRK